MSFLNFRCFGGNRTLHFVPGINYFVGNNNCGKTTVFRAIEFLLSGKGKEGWITKGKENEEVFVEITLEGDDIPEILQSEDLKKYQPYISSDNKIVLRRSSIETPWKPSKKHYNKEYRYIKS